MRVKGKKPTTGLAGPRLRCPFQTPSPSPRPPMKPLSPGGCVLVQPTEWLPAENAISGRTGQPASLLPSSSPSHPRGLGEEHAQVFPGASSSCFSGMAACTPISRVKPQTQTIHLPTGLQRSQKADTQPGVSHTHVHLLQTQGHLRVCTHTRVDKQPPHILSPNSGCCPQHTHAMLP